MPVKHAKVSGKIDAADATLVRPSDWNADHVFSGIIDLSGASSLVLPAAVSGNATHSGTETFTGQILCKDLENIKYVDAVNSQGWAGAELGAWINSAILALPTNAFGGKTGTIIVTTATPTTNVTVSSDPFSGRTATDRIHLILGPGQFATSASWNPPENTWLQGHGPRATVILANANVWAVQFTSGTTGGQYFRLSDLTVNGNKGAFPASGGVKVVGFGQPAEISNVLIQDFGSLGGLFWDGNAGVSSTNNVGGGIHDIFVIGDSAGTAGGAGAGNGITINNMSAFTAEYVLSEYSPSAFIVQNTSGVVTVGQISLDGFHSEGVTGAIIDLQANVNGFTAHNLNINGGGASAIGIKIATTTSNWDIQGASIITGAGLLAQFQIGGTNFTSVNSFTRRITPAILDNASGVAYWAGLTSPFDATAPVTIRSNALNELILADATGNPLIVGTNLGTWGIIGSVADPIGIAGRIYYRTDLGRLRYFDTAWHSIPGLDTTDTLTNKTLIAPIINGVSVQVGTAYTFVAADEQKLVTFNNAAAVAATLPQATTTGFGAGASFHVHNRGAGTVTITPTTSTIDGAASLALTTGQGVDIYSDGTNYFTQRGMASGGGGGPTSGDWTTVSGTAVNFRPNPRVLAVLHEEFIAGSATSGSIGEMGWASTGGSINPIAGLLNHPGIIDLNTSATSGTIANLFTNNNVTDAMGPLNSSTWSMFFVFRSNMTTQVKLRVGITDGPATDPPSNGMWLENVSAVAATGWIGVTSSGGVRSTTAAGPVLDATFHTLEIRSTAGTSIGFFLDGIQVGANLTTNIPTAGGRPFFQIVNTEAVAKTLDLDAFTMWLSVSR